MASTEKVRVEWKHLRLLRPFNACDVTVFILIHSTVVGMFEHENMPHRSVDELQLHSGELNNFPMMSEGQMLQRTQTTIADRLIEDAAMSRLVENTNPPPASVEPSDYTNCLQTNTTKELSFQPKPVKPPKRFDCLFCGKIFNYLSSLKVHIRRHSGEKPFSCSVCGKRFAQKTYLKLHQRVHSGEKPYSCPDCGKSFSQKSSLNIHLRTHTGEKPYSCVECGKCYAYKYGLNHHQCFNWTVKPELFDIGPRSTAQSDSTCASISLLTPSMEEKYWFETKIDRMFYLLLPVLLFCHVFSVIAETNIMVVKE